MLMLAIVASGIIAMPAAIADAPQINAAPSPQTRKVGEKFQYSLHAVMSQSIAGNDAFGRAIDQKSAPTNVKGHEEIAITKTAAQGLTLHRTGSITAIVDGAKPVTKSGQGWSLVDPAGMVLRDSGKLGGLFLLPLPFLGDASMNAGNDLKIGDSWSGQLGTRLYGMTARPRMQFTVVGERAVLGINVYTIRAVGTAPMKEPVMTAAGEPLGYATGTANITVALDYDRKNHRLISMQAELRDTLRYAGPTKRAGGSVRDRQQLSVALDPASMTDGLHASTGADPAHPPATIP
jgi:hypothetical protein